MKRILAFVLLATCAHAGAPVVAPPAAKPPDVSAVVEQYRQAWEVRSIDALAPLYFPSDELVVVRQGRAWRGWDAVKGGLGQFFEKAQKVELKLANPTVNEAGQGGAVVTADAHLTWNESGVITDQQGELTLVLRNSSAGWKIVGEHYSFAATP